MIKTGEWFRMDSMEPILDLHLKEARSHYYKVNRKSVFVAIGVCFCVLILVIVFVTLGCIYSGISKPNDKALKPNHITAWCKDMIDIPFLAEFCEPTTCKPGNRKPAHVWACDSRCTHRTLFISITSKGFAIPFSRFDDRVRILLGLWKCIKWNQK